MILENDDCPQFLKKWPVRKFNDFTTDSQGNKYKECINRSDVSLALEFGFDYLNRMELIKQMSQYHLNFDSSIEHGDMEKLFDNTPAEMYTTAKEHFKEKLDLLKSVDPSLIHSSIDDISSFARTTSFFVQYEKPGEQISFEDSIKGIMNCYEGLEERLNAHFCFTKTLIDDAIFPFLNITMGKQKSITIGNTNVLAYVPDSKITPGIMHFKITSNEHAKIEEHKSIYEMCITHLNQCEGLIRWENYGNTAINTGTSQNGIYWNIDFTRLVIAQELESKMRTINLLENVYH